MSVSPQAGGGERYNDGVHTSCSVQASSTAVAFEVLCLLMRNKELQILEVSLAIVAPRPRQQLLDVGVAALLLSHGGGSRWWIGIGTKQCLCLKVHALVGVVMVYAIGDCALYSTVMLVVSRLEEFGNSLGSNGKSSKVEIQPRVEKMDPLNKVGAVRKH